MIILSPNKNNAKKEEKELIKMGEITLVPVESHISAILHSTPTSKPNTIKSLLLPKNLKYHQYNHNKSILPHKNKINRNPQKP